MAVRLLFMNGIMPRTNEEAIFQQNKTGSQKIRRNQTRPLFMSPRRSGAGTSKVVARVGKRPLRRRASMSNIILYLNIAACDSIGIVTKEGSDDSSAYGR